MKLYAWLLALFGCSPTVITGGVPNLAPIDEAKSLWRGGQITTAEGWETLKKLGVERVVKLDYDEEGRDDLAQLAGLEVSYLPIEPKGDLVSIFDRPNPVHIAAAVAILRGGHAYVHCKHGQDRTGIVVAVLRVVAYGSSKSDALHEAIEHGYHVELPALTYWYADWDGRL